MNTKETLDELGAFMERYGVYSEMPGDDGYRSVAFAVGDELEAALKQRDGLRIELKERDALIAELRAQAARLRLALESVAIVLGEHRRFHDKAGCPLAPDCRACCAEASYANRQAALRPEQPADNAADAKG